MNNREKLKKLLIDVFLLDPGEFHFELTRNDIDTWDSLGMVAMAVGIDEAFGYHLMPDEVAAIKGVSDIIKILETKGIPFDD